MQAQFSAHATNAAGLWNVGLGIRPLAEPTTKKVHLPPAVILAAFYDDTEI
jgi:hypothetical protein